MTSAAIWLSCNWPPTLLVLTLQLASHSIGA